MRILVSDFDDTFYPNEFEKNVKLVNDFVELGNMFVIATGRSFYELKKIIGSDINYSYLICRDGAVIYDKMDQKIYEKCLDDYLVPLIYNDFINNNGVYNVFIDNGLFYTNDVNCKAISIVATIKDFEKANDLLNEVLFNYHNITGYLSKNHINILDKNSNKAIAIKYLIDNFNLDINDVYTIGDHVNDIKMLNDYKGFASIYTSNFNIKNSFNLISIENLIKKIS